MISILITIHLLISPFTFSDQGQKIPPVAVKEILKIGGKKEFIRIEEIASDRQGNIYVTDAYRYCIKKYSPAGTLLMEYGKRGKNRADFGTAPYKIICHDKSIAVATKGSAVIQLFAENFVYIDQISLPGVITDMIFDRNGRIFAGIIPYDKNDHRILLLVEKSGKIVASANSHKLDAGTAFSLMHISAGKENTIIVTYRFMNTIAVYSDLLKLIKTFSVPDLLPEAPSCQGLIYEMGKVPEGDLIKDAGTDSRGNIFILLGDYNNDPARSVCILDPDGKNLGHFQLPAKSGILYIDGSDHIYTRENQRTVVKKYTLTNAKIK